jgi:hypothetical protein
MRPLGIADLASSDRGSANWVGMHMDPGAASASGVADPTIRIGLAGSGGDHFPGTLLGITARRIFFQPSGSESLRR